MRGYIAKKIHQLRASPTAWKEFDQSVQEIRAEMHVANDIVHRNVHSVMDWEPESVRRRRKQQSLESKERSHSVLDRRDAIEEAFVATIVTVEKRRELRHHLQAVAWMPHVYLALAAAALLAAHRTDHQKRVNALWSVAVVALERAWLRHKRGIRKLNPIQAFIIRARFLRRCLTRIRYRMLRRFTDRVVHVLRKADFNTRLLMAFRAFHHRVVQGQMLWRQRAEIKRLQQALRCRQWSRYISVRKLDLHILIEKLERESVEYGRTLPQLEISKLEKQAIDSRFDDALRDRVLEEARADYKVSFVDDVRKYEAVLKQSVGSRGIQQRNRLRPPHQRVLLPKNLLEGLIRQTAREIGEKIRADEKAAQQAAALAAVAAAKAARATAAAASQHHQQQQQGPAGGGGTAAANAGTLGVVLSAKAGGNSSASAVGKSGKREKEVVPKA